LPEPAGEAMQVTGFWRAASSCLNNLSRIRTPPIAGRVIFASAVDFNVLSPIVFTIETVIHIKICESAIFVKCLKAIIVNFTGKTFSQ
jgi:hypothetical protein